MTLSRFALALCFGFTLAACDSTPSVPAQATDVYTPEAEVAPLPMAYSVNDYASWVPLATYDLEAEEVFDLQYAVTLPSGDESEHGVRFIDKEGDTVVEYRYLERAVAVGETAAGFDAEARWPGVSKKRGTFIVLVDESPVQIEPVNSGTIGNWVSLGITSIPGRSVHRKPGETRVDFQTQVYGEYAQCTTPGGYSGDCEEFTLRYGAVVPEVEDFIILGPPISSFTQLQ
ncbi:MAG: hypothetical protein AAFQ43_00580 [Bacteroidota bacterium]